MLPRQNGARVKRASKWRNRLGKRLESLSPKARRRAAMVTIIASMIVILYLVSDHSRAQGPQVPEPSFLSGWHLGLPKESQGDAQALELEGTFRPGQTAFVPSGALFTVEAQPIGAKGKLLKPEDDRWDHTGGELQPPLPGTNKLVCRAPEAAGVYHLKWVGTPTPTGHNMLTILVLARAKLTRKGTKTHISTFDRDIGAYCDPCASGTKHVQEHAARYAPPRYFVRIEEETENIDLSEGLKLGQMVAFMDKRDRNGRKIFTTRRHTDVFPPSQALIAKLAALRTRLREKGINVTRFWITSGFRTPSYNKSIGGATFSRHCYGDAVDVCIDENNDKHMDDLNGDGKLNRHDGEVIGKACLELEREGKVVPGGIGVYEYDGLDSVRSHVHIDCRGFTARWGQIRRGKKKIAYDWWSRLEKKSEKSGKI